MVATDEVRSSFMYRTMRKLEGQRVVAVSDGILLLFAGEFDRTTFAELGYKDVTLSNIDPHSHGADLDEAMVIDAHHLPFTDDSFDHVIAHAGLHHASRPHQAVCEMYRVAKKSLIFFEAQDSLLMRAAIRLGFVAAYEFNAIIDSGGTGGGVDGKPIPNYVYRWSPRELRKMVCSLDPARRPRIILFREWDFYYRRVARRLSGTRLRRVPAPILRGLSWLAVSGLNSCLSSQGNGFGACIIKGGEGIQPWLHVTPSGEIGLKPNMEGRHILS